MTSKHRIYPFKPLSIAVGNTSTMILPPIRDSLNPAMINDWVTGTIYAQGAIVRSNGRYYWATVGGTSGATAPIQTDGDATDGLMNWRVVRGLREVISVTNMGEGTVFVARGYPAVASAGIVLYKGGSQNEGYENGEVRPYDGAYYAISDSTVTLAISEG